MSLRIDDYLVNISSAAIAGHLNPDGDCVGSCCGLYSYITDNYPDMEVDLYLEDYKSVFCFLKGTESVKKSYSGKRYDRVFLLDVSSTERIGVSGDLLHAGKDSICIDHHISNSGFANVNIIEPTASSAAEVLYTLLDPERVSSDTAAAIYTGIVHDSGVFQYSSTSKRTMQIAGELMEKGIPYTDIVQESFYGRTYSASRILGCALYRMRRLLEEKCVYTYLTQEDLETCGATKTDIDGISAQMKLTYGVETAVLIYPSDDNSCKVSMRSSSTADVSRVAQQFGGGGHVHAAGCTLPVLPENAEEVIMPAVEEELRRNGFLS